MIILINFVSFFTTFVWKTLNQKLWNFRLFQREREYLFQLNLTSQLFVFVSCYFTKGTQISSEAIYNNISLCCRFLERLIKISKQNFKKIGNETKVCTTCKSQTINLYFISSEEKNSFKNTSFTFFSLRNFWKQNNELFIGMLTEEWKKRVKRKRNC